MAEEETPKYIVGDRLLDPWGNGDFITEDDKAALHAGEASDDEDEEESYKTWTTRQLKAELEKRGFDSTGSKAQLIAWLEADDEKGEQ